LYFLAVVAEHFFMRRRFFFLMLCYAQVAAAHAQVLAFPEAEGFGRYTTGARTNLAAASVYHVTNLNDSGSGSFRDAVSQSNRFVVFDVGGIINANSVVTVASNITIAGQTAPGGITLYNNRISFTSSNNLISRFFAVRKGTTSGREDSASIARGTNMIFDHMSITWGVDANFDINPDSGYVIDNITIQNSIIGQGLDNVGHSTGGLMQPGSGGSVSVIKSLYTDNVTRNPKVRDENEFINNVVYGWQSNGYIMGDTSGSSWANVEGNYFIEGPIDGSGPFNSGTPTFNIYANDNWVDTNRNGTLDGTLVTSYPGSTVVGARHAFPTTASMTAQEAVDYVTANAGPSIIRDAVDSRMMQEVASYGLVGGVIERESDLFPGYGTNSTYLNPRARLTDADHDGMADNWELSRGLNPANATDWKGLNGGYTRLEEYVNELGAIGTTVNSTGGAWTTPATWNGTTPTLADDAVVAGTLTVATGHGFARRLNVAGSLAVTGGTLDVFDTTSLDGTNTISGGTFTSGRVLLGSFGQSGSLEVSPGGTLQSGTVAAGGGSGSLALNGGTFRAGGAPDIRVPVSLGPAGGTIDTNGYNGTVTGAIAGAGGLSKLGAGDLKLSGANSYTGPTLVTGGSLSVTSSAMLNSSSAIQLGEGTTLNVASIAGGYVTGNGQTISGAGQITGSLVTTAGSVLKPQGGEFVPTAHMVGIQAENMTLGADWTVFDNAIHGTGAGGSYNGADLNGGGIVTVSNAGGTAPVATGVATATVDIPVAGTWYLYARTAEPAVSPIPGDPATQPGGNNSFFTSTQAGTLQATTSNYEEVQTYANPGNAAVWNLLSPSLSPLSGVVTPLNAGITYSLASGTQQFAIYGRESGTIIDAFVLSTTNLNATQLDSVLAGTTVLGYSTGTAISGNYTQQASSVLKMQLGSNEQNTLLVGATASLGGNLAVELLDGFIPHVSDSFTILSAGDLINTFAGLPEGARVNTIGTQGSFVINYDYMNHRVVLSNFLAGIAGDFDGDGKVDGRDFLLWQRNPSVGNLSDWQANYGAVAVAGLSTSAIPEPGTLLLTSLAFIAWLSRR
jgi:autotransporter-associated beta strand protein